MALLSHHRCSLAVVSSLGLVLQESATAPLILSPTTPLLTSDPVSVIIFVLVNDADMFGSLALIGLLMGSKFKDKNLYLTRGIIS